MRRLLYVLLLGSLFLSSCKDENTYVIGPADWQPPVLTWISPPDAQLRGTVGLDVQVLDSSLIDRVTLFVDGSENRSVNQTPYRFELHSDSLTDGVHLCEARAWDQFGNLGISPVLRVYAANGFPEGIRVLWVPDSFATIQAAINASQDYDTIRVRDGTYYETLNLFGKGIWIESEHGPLRCTINAAGSSRAFHVPASEIACTLRGFWITGGNILISLNEARVTVSNNIVWSDTADGLINTYYAGGSIRNNLLHGGDYAAVVAYHWGDFENNVLENSIYVALFNSAIYGNPVFHGFNAFWQNAQDYAGFTPGPGEFVADPQVDLSHGDLFPGSPCINSGDSTIFDVDGTRSDIGPFGGPLAY